MKKVRILLATAAIVAVVGGAYAFTSVKSTAFFKLDANGDCKQQFLGTKDNVSPFIAYNTNPSNGACPLTARIRVPE